MGRYAVECLCLEPTPSIKCQATVTDAAGRKSSHDVPLRIDPGETPQGDPSDEWTMLPKEKPPSDSGTPDRSAVLRMLVGKEDSTKPMLLFFNADWCAPCQKVWPEIRRLRAEGVTVLDVNVDTYRDEARDCEVDRIPTTIFCKDGAEVDRVVGPQIESFVEKHRNEMGAVDPSTTAERVVRELESLQGFWGTTTAISNVDQIPIPKDLSRKWIEGDVLTLQSEDEEKSSIVVRYRLDPHTIPRQLDLLPNGPVDVPRYGIYATEGDRLSIVFGSKRPTGFDVDLSDPGCLLWELTREEQSAATPNATDPPEAGALGLE